jgi:hypothetical protein
VVRTYSVAALERQVSVLADRLAVHDVAGVRMMGLVNQDN